MTKIFCDIADINQIKKFNRKKIVKGFTTNPSLMRRAGAKDYSAYSKKILKITKNYQVTWKKLYLKKIMKIISGVKEKKYVKNI